MERRDAFERFYLSTRDSVYRQVFLLTGDLTAASAAVREAYVMAWHHWARIERLADPLDYVRPVAWRLARRKHSGRIWHRNRGLPDHAVTVLQALARVPQRQRRMLVLVDFAGIDLDRAAEEADLTPEEAQTALSRARARMANRLDIAQDTLGERLRATAGAVPDEVVLPPTDRLVRQGGRRRQRFLVVAAAGVLALAVGAGTAVRDPDLDRGVSARVASGAPGDPSSPGPVSEPEDTVADLLLTSAEVRALGPGVGWRVNRTIANTRGDGLNYLCQQARFADPEAVAGLVRFFAARGTDRTAIQSLEISEGPEAAQAAFGSVVAWFGSCREARLQLLETYRVDGVGDEATVLVLRHWRKPVATYSVGVARVDSAITAIVSRAAGVRPPAPRQVVNALARGASRLCGEDRPRCAARPRWEPAPLPRSGEERGMLAVVDLPPVGGIERPWVGIDAEPAREGNQAATTCDDADFSGAEVRRSRTRTYLIPEARVPPRFGLSQTIADFRNQAQATQFVARLRTRIANCGDRDPTTTVDVLVAGGRPQAALDLSSYLLSTQVTEDRTVRIRTGVARAGTQVTQVTFVPSDVDRLTDRQFNDLLLRAGRRLDELR